MKAIIYETCMWFMLLICDGRNIIPVKRSNDDSEHVLTVYIYSSHVSLEWLYEINGPSFSLYTYYPPPRINENTIPRM